MTTRVTLAVLLALVLPATALAGVEKTVKHSTSSGDYATTVVSATVSNPKRIRVKYAASPSQSIQVSWTILCSRGFSASTKSGQHTYDQPGIVTLKHPMLSKASSCIVSADAQLQGSGKLTLSILATKR